MKRLLRSLAAFVGTLLVLLLVTVVALLLVDAPASGPVAGIANERIDLIDPPPGRAWSVAVLSDVQKGFAYLPEILESVAAREPQAILALGDVAIEGSAAHMSLPAQELARSPVPAPLFVIPGNHDVDDDTGREAFLERFGSTAFDVTIGETRFLGFDNADGALTADQLTDLEARLEASSRRNVLCLHLPIIDLAGDKPQIEELNRELLGLIARHDVPLVIAGHHHYAHDVVRDGTRYLVVPPSGDQSRDVGTAVVSYTLLHGGEPIRAEVVQLARRNAPDLRGRFLHTAVAHIQPDFDESRGTFIAGFVVLALAGILALRFAAGGP